MTAEKNDELVRIIKYRKEHPRCSCANILAMRVIL